MARLVSEFQFKKELATATDQEILYRLKQAWTTTYRMILEAEAKKRGIWG